MCADVEDYMNLILSLVVHLKSSAAPSVVKCWWNYMSERYHNRRAVVDVDQVLCEQ